MYAPISIMKKHVLIMSRRSKNIYQKDKPFILFFEKILHQYMDCITANSKDIVFELIEEGINSSRIELIYNGV